MRQAYVGIDLAIAKEKYLPVVVCTWNRVTSFHNLSAASASRASGKGHAATLDSESVQRFSREAATYIAAVCDRLGLTATRIGIDAPSAPRSPNVARRAAEAALDQAGISCFATPSAYDFDVIRAKVAQHLSSGGAEGRIPHANQLWMLVGFALLMSSRTWHRGWRCFLKRRRGPWVLDSFTVSGWCGRGSAVSSRSLHRLAYASCG